MHRAIRPEHLSVEEIYCQYLDALFFSPASRRTAFSSQSFSLTFLSLDTFGCLLQFDFPDLCLLFRIFEPRRIKEVSRVRH